MTIFNSYFDITRGCIISDIGAELRPWRQQGAHNDAANHHGLADGPCGDWLGPWDREKNHEYPKKIRQLLLYKCCSYLFIYPNISQYIPLLIIIHHYLSFISY